MITTGGLINVYSDMNSWMDYVISVYGGMEKFTKAKEIIDKAFNSWFEDAESTTMADWIKEKLDAAGITYDFYYKDGCEEYV